jgi:hypothetical protein
MVNEISEGEPTLPKEILLGAEIERFPPVEVSVGDGVGVGVAVVR